MAAASRGRSSTRVMIFRKENSLKKIILGLVILIFPLTAKQNADKIIKRVQDKYEDVQYFSAEFIQKEEFKMTGSVNQVSGKIYVKNGVQYRLETEDRVIVTDGKTTWSYSYLRNQVIVDNMKEGDAALLPRDMLFKFPKKYFASYLGEEKINDITYYLIKLDPKEDVKGYIKSMKIWVHEDDYTIIKIEYTDYNDNPTTFAIRKQDNKTKIPEDIFNFKAPEDCEIVDFR